MHTLPRDPWVDVKTYHDFPADQVISALQKEIRRGHTENAALLAYAMVNWIIKGVGRNDLRPKIPDYALDKHTAAGQTMGRGDRHFWEVGAKLEPELPGRDTTYRDRVLAMLEEGEGE